MSDKAKRSHIERLVYVSPDVESGSSLRYGDWQDKPGHDALIERWESENHTPTDQT